MAGDGAQRADFAGIQALASRSAGYAVAEKCLEVQSKAELADPSLRTGRSYRLADEAWSWYVGALGEIEVGRMLAALGPEWFVRHAVPIGAKTKDVDHLVIGPGGVFAINTKHHGGAAVWIGDKAEKINSVVVHHVSRARHDAAEASQRLTKKAEFPVPVTPVVALLNPASIKDGRATHQRTVTVLDARGLVSWLKAQRTFLSPATLDLIKLAAEEPDTWHVDPRAADTLRVMQRFERLVKEVGPQPPKPVSATGARPTRTSGTTTARRPKDLVPSQTKQHRQTASQARTRAARRPHRSWASSVAELFQIWFVTGMPVVGILILQGAATQPCDPGTLCLLPAFFAGFGPFIPLGITILLGVGVVRTLGWLVRALR